MGFIGTPSVYVYIEMQMLTSSSTQRLILQLEGTPIKDFVADF